MDDDDWCAEPPVPTDLRTWADWVADAFLILALVGIMLVMRACLT